MKNINFVTKALNILAFICTPATLVLAILWFLQPEKNYEPITVALGSASAIFIITAQVIQNKYVSQESETKKFDEFTTDEILEIVKDSTPDDWDVNFNQDADIAVFKKNPSLRIETRHTDEFVHNGGGVDESGTGGGDIKGRCFQGLQVVLDEAGG